MSPQLDQARLASVTLPEASAWAGRRLEELALHAVGVAVVSVRHASGRVAAPAPEDVLAGGDTLVISGLPEPLALAEAKLLGRG